MLFATGLVTNRGRRVSQAGHRVLRRAPDAFGHDETVAGALFDSVVRRHVTDGHRHRRRGQQSRRDGQRDRVLGGPAGPGHWHVDVRGVLRSAETVRRTLTSQTTAIATSVHRHRFRVHAVHSVDDNRMNGGRRARRSTENIFLTYAGRGQWMVYR